MKSDYAYFDDMLKPGDEVICLRVTRSGITIARNILNCDGKIGVVVARVLRRSRPSELYRVNFSGNVEVYNVCWLHKTISQEIVDGKRKTSVS